jgi:hypothetical protein
MDSVKIHVRQDRCNCGCEGRDPWHAKTFQRRLHDVTPETGVARFSASEVAGGVECPYDQRATVRLPWSEDPVAVVHRVFVYGDRVISLGWWVPR